MKQTGGEQAGVRVSLSAIDEKGGSRARDPTGPRFHNRDIYPLHRRRPVSRLTYCRRIR